MAAIDTARRIELEQIVHELRRAARTIRSQTLAERREMCDTLVASVREHVEPHAQLDPPGLEAIGIWADALEHAAVSDLDLLQELLYGMDALVRVHLWRETGMPLEPPEPRPPAEI
ncbi:MAG TPA: hypothetical protein VNH40_04045 [Gaiellaceae bacterium]|nr:hypothetical protein [Gaiellaceae bacterium]